MSWSKDRKPWWRRTDACLALQLAVLAGLAAAELLRAGLRSDVDALIISALSALLFWVQLGEWRRRRQIGGRLDALLLQQR